MPDSNTQHEQQAPQPAPQPTPTSRRGLPLGAWIGIGAAAVAVVAAVLVAALVIVPNVLQNNSQGAGSADQAEGENPADSVPVVTLDDRLDYAVGPFWVEHINNDWRPHALGNDGPRLFSHRKNTCQLYTYFGEIDLAADVTDDRAATQAAVSLAWEEGLDWGLAPEVPEPEAAGSVEIIMNDEEPVELARFSAQFETEEEFFGGFVAHERHVIVRAFAETGTFVHATIDCRDEHADGIDEVITKIGITDVTSDIYEETDPRSELPRRVDGEPHPAYVITYDEFFYRHMGPFWDTGTGNERLEIAPGWIHPDPEPVTPTIEYRNDASECRVHTMVAQDRHTVEAEVVPSDRESTTGSALERVRQFPDIDADEESIERLENYLGLMEMGVWIEMDRYRVPFTLDGEEWERQTLLRIFQPEARLVQMNIDCPSGSADEIEEIVSEVRLFSDVWAVHPETMPE